MGDGWDTRGTIFDPHTGTGAQIGEHGGYRTTDSQADEDVDPDDIEESNGIEPTGHTDWLEEEEE
jgi:hypothetical protein